MPHLKVFNQYLRIGGDDIAVPLTLFITGRTMWLTILVIIIYLDFKELTKCTNGIILVIYLYMTILHLILALLLDCATLYVSLRGTIVTNSKREGLNGLVKTRFTLSLLQAITGLVGIVGLAYSDRIPCTAKKARSDINIFIFVIIIASQLLDALSFFLCATFLIGSAPQPDIRIKSDSESEIARVQDNFKKLLQYAERLFGWSSNLTRVEANESLAEVARVITKYFHNHGFLDVVVSDIVAGILLVRTEQRTNRIRSWRNALESTRNAFTDIHGEEIKSAGTVKRIATLPHGTLQELEFDDETANESNVDQMRMLARCSVYAALIYNQIQPLSKPSCCMVCCQKTSQYPNSSYVKLCCCCWIGSVPNSNSEEIEKEPGYSVAATHGLNFIGYRRIGVSYVTQELSKTELVFISFRNDTIHKPFAIFVDHEEQNIVITIRGTLSVEDAITDAACEPVEMTDVGVKWGFNGRGRWAHAGVLRAADAMREEIEESQILTRIYEHLLPDFCNVGLSQPIFQHMNNVENYSILVTGHSLGAAAATILAMLLIPRYPTLRCIGFGTPGATLDIKTCEDVSHYVTTVIVGNDIVPRLGVRPLCTFRDEILLSIARAKVNKAYIMQAMFRDIDSEELMYHRGQEPDSEFLQQYRMFQRAVHDQLDNPNTVEMFLPGKIRHLIKYRFEWTRCSLVSHYALVKGSPHDYTNIAVSTSMLSDHYPDVYHREIHRLYRAVRRATYSTILSQPF